MTDRSSARRSQEQEPETSPADGSPPAAAATERSRSERVASEASTSADGRPLSDAAKRALAEAEERRRTGPAGAESAGAAKEHGGRDGPEPVRYGDWEVKGIATDF